MSLPQSPKCTNNENKCENRSRFAFSVLYLENMVDWTSEAAIHGTQINNADYTTMVQCLTPPPFPLDALLVLHKL